MNRTGTNNVTVVNLLASCSTKQIKQLSTFRRRLKKRKSPEAFDKPAMPELGAGGLFG